MTVVASSTDIWQALKEEVVGLHGTRKLMRDLYGANADTVDLLNRSAGVFFASLERMMVRDLIIGIARLTDRAAQGDHANLSLGRLADLDWVVADPDCARALTDKLAAVATAARQFRVLRNKAVAHLDMPTRLNDELIPGVTIRELDRVLQAIADAMNEAARPLGSTTFYADVIQFGGAETLIKRLQQAEKWREQERRRLAGALPEAGEESD